MSGPPLLEYTGFGWHFSLPTIRALNFERSTLDNFLVGNRAVPLVLDITFPQSVLGGCDNRCLYCFTSYGNNAQYKAPAGAAGQQLTLEQGAEIIRQYAALGGRALILVSEAEPLMQSTRFLALAGQARRHGLEVVTYTNGNQLTPALIRELHALSVNLIWKLEGVAERADAAGVSRKTDELLTQPVVGKRYGMIGTSYVPEPLINALHEYGADTDMLALCSLITAVNYDDILSIRGLAYHQGCAHFLKQFHYGNAAWQHIDALALGSRQLASLAETLRAFDSAYSVRCIAGQENGVYHDVRAFLAHAAGGSMPARVVIQSNGELFKNHGGQVLAGPAYAGNPSVLDTQGRVDVEGFFAHIRSNATQN